MLIERRWSTVGSSPDIMSKRPLSISVIGCIFLAAGLIGLGRHATEFNPQRLLEYDLVLGCFVQLLAILGGVFVLRANNWARWLLLAWIAFHVILSAFHSLFELIVHSLLFAVVAYVLFRPQASAYFRGATAESPQTPK